MPININIVINVILNKTFGIIIPRTKPDILKILVNYQLFIKDYLKDINSLSVFKEHLEQQKKKGYPIGDLEIPVFVYSELISDTSMHDDKIIATYKTVKEKLRKNEDLAYELYILINSIILHNLG